MTLDPMFGPLVAFGLGGIHVEVLADVAFRVVPLADRDATEMVRGIRGVRLIEGYRGHPSADLEAIGEVLLRLSRLAEEVPEVGEIDLNPIFSFRTAPVSGSPTRASEFATPDDLASALRPGLHWGCG